MSMPWRFFIFLISWSAVVPTHCQQNRIDSLQQVAQAHSNDSLKIMAMLQLGFHYIFNDSKKAWQYIAEVEEKLILNSMPYGKVYVRYVKAVYYDVTGSIDSARYYFESGNDLSKQHNFPDLEVKFVNGLGMNSWNRGHYSTALEYFFSVLEVNERVQEQQKIPVSTPYNNIGLIYQEMGLYEKALAYHYKALDYRLKDPKLIAQVATSYNNLGICLTHLGQYEEAEKAYRDGIAITNEYNFLRQYYDLINNLANTLVAMKRHHEALKLNLEILNPEKKIVLPEKFLMNIHAATAGVYIELNQPEKAIQHVEHGLKIIEAEPELEFYASDLFKFGSAAYYLTGNHEKGRDFGNRVAKVLEDKFSKRNAESMAEFQTKFETAQKEKRIVDQQLLLEQKNTTLARQRNQNLILASAMIIIVLSGSFYYATYRVRERSKLQQVIIEAKEKGLEAVFLATEEERQRISKDLHDGVGQQLSGLKMKLESLEGQMVDTVLKEKARSISNNLKDAADEVRHISHQMMPRSLTELGLVAALDDLLHKTFEHTPIKCSFGHHRAEKRFDNKIEVSLYRVAQELLNNVIKHAGAKTVSVQLFCMNDKLMLTIEDDGKGFNPGSSSQGHGLINLNSRVNTIKGSIAFEPVEASGMLVTVTVPLK